MIDIKALAYDRSLRCGLDPWARSQPRSEHCWLRRIPCKYGWVGVHGRNELAAFCGSRRVGGRLLTIRGVRLHQDGDHELSVVFGTESLDAVLGILQPRRTASPAYREQCAIRARARMASGYRPFVGAVS